MDISHFVLHYIFDTRSVFSLNRTHFFCYKSQAFAKSSTLASSGVRKNVYPNNKLEMSWKILFLIIYLFVNFILKT